MLSQHRKLLELLHALITVLYVQILILNSKRPQFPQLDFLYLIDYVVFDTIVLNQIKNMGFVALTAAIFYKRDSDFNKVFLFSFLRGSTLRDPSSSLIVSYSTKSMAACDFNLFQLLEYSSWIQNSEFQFIFLVRRIPDEAPVICYGSFSVTD